MEGAIDETQPWGTHIDLRCKEHPHLRWFTKNIGGIGARSIFFRGDTRFAEVKDPMENARATGYGEALAWTMRKASEERDLMLVAATVGRIQDLQEQGIDPVIECPCPVSLLEVVPEEDR